MTEQTITCGKCGHQRNADDGEPAWCCPSCGVVYAKLAATMPPRPTRQRATASALDVPFTGTRRQWAIVGLMLASIATIGWLWWRADQSRAAVQLAQAEAEAHDAPLRAARAAQTQYLDDRDALAPLITQWSEEVHKAAATPRMLLASRIDRLDAVIARIPSARVHGECMRTARDMFAAAARQRRDAFLAFAAQNSTSEATTRASALEQRLVEQMAACKPTDSSM